MGPRPLGTVHIDTGWDAARGTRAVGESGVGRLNDVDFAGLTQGPQRVQDPAGGAGVGTLHWPTRLVCGARKASGFSYAVAMVPLVAHLRSVAKVLWLLCVLGCQPQVEAPVAPADTLLSKPLPSWSEPVAGVSLVAKDHDWVLLPVKGAEGATGVNVRVSGTCEGRLWRTRISETADMARADALEARLRSRLAALEVSDVVVRDRGEVAHGTFRAFMLRVDGRRGGDPWSARLVGSFVTRSEGRFYVEIVASSQSSGFVARRGCFDVLGASVTIRAERR